MNNLLYRGIEHYNKGRYELAVTDFTECIQNDTIMKAALGWRGSTYFKMAEFGRAAEDFSKGEETPEMLWNWGNSLYHDCKIEGAKKVLSRIADDPRASRVLKMVDASNTNNSSNTSRQTNQTTCRSPVQLLLRVITESHKESNDHWQWSLSSNNSVYTWMITFRYPNVDINTKIEFEKNLLAPPKVSIVSPRVSSSNIFGGALCLHELSTSVWNLRTLPEFIVSLHYFLSSCEVDVRDRSIPYSQTEILDGHMHIAASHTDWGLQPKKVMNRLESAKQFQQQGEQEFNKGAYIKSTELFKKAIRNNPKIGTRHWLGASLLMEGNYKESVKQLQQLLSEQPSGYAPTLVIHLATGCFHLREYKRSAEILLKAAEFDSRNSLQLTKTEPTNVQLAEEMFYIAISEYIPKVVDTKSTSHIMKLQLRCEDILLRRTYGQKSRLFSALRTLRRTPKDAAAKLTVVSLEADRHFGRGEYSQFAKLLEQKLALEKRIGREIKDTKYQLGVAYFNLGQLKKSEEHFNDCGQIPEADLHIISDIQRYVSLFGGYDKVPTEALHLMARGRYCVQNNKTNSAITYLSECIDIVSAISVVLVDAHQWRGLCFFNSSDFQSALLDFVTVEAFYPTLPRSLWDVANTQFRTAHFEESRRTAERGLQSTTVGDPHHEKFIHLISLADDALDQVASQRLLLANK